MQGVDPAWLPDVAFRPIGTRRTLIRGSGPLVDTVHGEVARASERFGGSVSRESGSYDLVLELDGDDGSEGFVYGRGDGCTTVTASGARGLLYGFFHVVRLGETAFLDDARRASHRPGSAVRMLDHWDNVAVHPVMGQVERGYAGGSLFWEDGRARGDLERVRAYGRLLAACGINAVAVNNVNVHATEARLLTDRIGEVADIADMLRPYGIRTHLSVTFAAPVVLGGMASADPLDESVRTWWAEATARVYTSIPDFGGFVVKADSEGQPGPFAYGRSHADGANMLAAALAPHGGTVHWRAFVYDHHQDWRDRSTDRARAAYDHFVPLDGEFADNAVLQVKHGPMDFQVREPVSPLIGAMPGTRLAVELQATQEYTGQQRHVCWLGPMWSEVLRFGIDGESSVGAQARGGLVAVANVGDDPFWTGHPLAQANLYTFGRLAWDPNADPHHVLDEWIRLTFGPGPHSRRVCARSWTARGGRTRSTPLPSVWGSWSSRGTTTGRASTATSTAPGAPTTSPTATASVSTGAWRPGPATRGSTRSPGPTCTNRLSCPDELLLFFHHVSYGHMLHSGKTVIQHIYDTHFEGVAEVEAARERWASLVDLVEPARHARVVERFEEQLRSAREWRDQVNSYFFRKSGVADERGRTIY